MITLNRVTLPCALLGIMLLLFFITYSARGQVLIDNFSTTQSLSATGVGSTDAGYVSDGGGADILGEERDAHIEVTAGGQTLDLVTNSQGNGRLSHSQDSDVTGDSMVIWDGTDNDPYAIDYTGLAGVDMTDGGTQNALRIQVYTQDCPLGVQFDVYTDGSNWSIQTIAFPGLIFAPVGDITAREEVMSMNELS